jgi:transcriptional regulator with XRE-family HTH domain
MTTFLDDPEIRSLWSRLAKSRIYRTNYMAGFVKRSIPSQIRAWMKKEGLSQQELAKQAGLTQGVISRAADIDYGDLTLNTIIKIAAGLDCAFVGRYVPYSEFCKIVAEGPSEAVRKMPNFEEENKQLEAKESMHGRTSLGCQKTAMGSESKKLQSIGTLPPQPIKMRA